MRINELLAMPALEDIFNPDIVILITTLQHPHPLSLSPLSRTLTHSHSHILDISGKDIDWPSPRNEFEEYSMAWLLRS